MNWQPIHTAPTDGTPVIGFDPGKNNPNIYVVLYSKYNIDRGMDTGWEEAAGESYELWRPTHWMPLPKPPEE